MKKIFESKEYLKSKLDKSELRCRCLIDKLAIAMADIDELQEDVYRLEETVKCYREQLENENITPKSVVPDFGEKYLNYILLRKSREDFEKIEMFRQKITELEY